MARGSKTHFGKRSPMVAVESRPVGDTPAVATDDVIRLFYYNDEMPYYMDHGVSLAVGDTVMIHDVPFRVYRVRNVPENEEQRLWVE